MSEEKRPFEEYYQAYYQQVYLYVLRKISDSFEAENLTMDAFYACLKNYDSFDPAKASFKTWLFTVVNNRIKNYYRGNRQTDDIDDIDIATQDSTSAVDTELAVEDLRDVLAQAIKTLPYVQQQIVVYRYYKDKNANEIAEILDLNPGNVRAHLSRAMAKLRQYFEDHGIEWENYYG